MTPSAPKDKLQCPSIPAIVILSTRKPDSKYRQCRTQNYKSSTTSDDESTGMSEKKNRKSSNAEASEKDAEYPNPSTTNANPLYKTQA
jgi:hypothetical protein